MPHSKKRLSSKPGTKRLIANTYNLLYKTHGSQGWWPASTPFEVAIGAILTQNTSWSNVEKAILNLKKKKLLSSDCLHKASLKVLAKTIRPCGYYNIKAGTLKNFIRFLFANYKGKIENMRSKKTIILRNELLAINGIGPETCDSILLYALNKPVFVVDAYTRRIAECLDLADKRHDYDFIQSIFTDSLPGNASLFNEYHALIVCHAKKVCRKNPECGKCVLYKLKKE